MKNDLKCLRKRDIEVVRFDCEKKGHKALLAVMEPHLGFRNEFLQTFRIFNAPMIAKPAPKQKRINFFLTCEIDLCFPKILISNAIFSANRVFSRDVTAAMLVSLNKGKAAMLVSPINPPGIEFYSYANVSFCFG